MAYLPEKASHLLLPANRGTATAAEDGRGHGPM
jgi:hypothetical protein